MNQVKSQFDAERVRAMTTPEVERLAEQELYEILSVPAARRTAQQKAILDLYQQRYLSKIATDIFS